MKSPSYQSTPEMILSFLTEWRSTTQTLDEAQKTQNVKKHIDTVAVRETSAAGTNSFTTGMLLKRASVLTPKDFITYYDILCQYYPTENNFSTYRSLCIAHYIERLRVNGNSKSVQELLLEMETPFSIQDKLGLISELPNNDQTLTYCQAMYNEFTSMTNQDRINFASAILARETLVKKNIERHDLSVELCWFTSLLLLPVKANECSAEFKSQLELFNKRTWTEWASLKNQMPAAKMLGSCFEHLESFYNIPEDSLVYKINHHPNHATRLARVEAQKALSSTLAEMPHSFAPVPPSLLKMETKINSKASSSLPFAQQLASQNAQQKAASSNDNAKPTHSHFDPTSLL